MTDIISNYRQLTYDSRDQRYQVWHHSRSDWPQTGQIQEFFRSVSVHRTPLGPNLRSVMLLDWPVECPRCCQSRQNYRKWTEVYWGHQSGGRWGSAYWSHETWVHSHWSASVHDIEHWCRKQQNQTTQIESAKKLELLGVNVKVKSFILKLEYLTIFFINRKFLTS